MKDTEIEIQVKIEKKEKLVAFLEKEAEFVSEKNQVDEYFTPAHRDFLNVRPVQEWFRLRNENDEYSMNYKKWHYDEQGVGMYADEYETTIDDIESARKIVNSLDCKSIVVVDKTRKKYMYQDYEIALDKVVGLGDFVEIEYKGGKTVDYKQVNDEMIQFLRDLDCGRIERNNGGYPYLLLFPGEGEFIEVE